MGAGGATSPGTAGTGPCTPPVCSPLPAAGSAHARLLPGGPGAHGGAAPGRVTRGHGHSPACSRLPSTAHTASESSSLEKNQQLQAERREGRPHGGVAQGRRAALRGCGAGRCPVTHPAPGPHCGSAPAPATLQLRHTKSRPRTMEPARPAAACHETPGSGPKPAPVARRAGTRSLRGTRGTHSPHCTALPLNPSPPQFWQPPRRTPTLTQSSDLPATQAR